MLRKINGGYTDEFAGGAYGDQKVYWKEDGTFHGLVDNSNSKFIPAVESRSQYDRLWPNAMREADALARKDYAAALREHAVGIVRQFGKMSVGGTPRLAIYATEAGHWLQNSGILRLHSEAAAKVWAMQNGVAVESGFRLCNYGGKGLSMSVLVFEGADEELNNE